MIQVRRTCVSFRTISWITQSSASSVYWI